MNKKIDVLDFGSGMVYYPKDHTSCKFYTYEISSKKKSDSEITQNELINKKKAALRNSALSKYSSINGFNDSGYCDLTNSKPEEYSSGMFSKLNKSLNSFCRGTYSPKGTKRCL